MRILIAEDEIATAKALKLLLEKAKNSVDIVHTGTDAWTYVSSGAYEVVVLDIMMPGMSGLEVLSKMRREHITTPVLMLTAKAEIEDRVAGLEAGADDYLPKPFATSELIARVKALGRRSESYADSLLTVGNLVLDGNRYEMRVKDGYLQQLVDEYVNGGRFDQVYERIRTQIDGLVETDPTAFYSCEDYQIAAELLYETVKLRAESITGQLNGTIPSTDAGQRQDRSALIDASHIDIKAMGEFNMGGNFGGQKNEAGNSDTSAASDAKSGSMPGGFDRSDPPGNMPEGFDPSSMFGGGFSFSGMPGRSSGQSKTNQLLTFGVCLAIMLAALLLVRLYKRRK